MNIRDLLDKRAKSIADARAILDRANAENRELTAEEQGQWDALLAEADKLQGQADREQRQATLEAGLSESAAAPLHTQQGTEQRGGQPSDAERRMASFRRILGPWLLRDFRGIPDAELRALQNDLDASGGYLHPPEQFVNDLIKNVDNLTFVRQWATVYQVANADTLGIPTLEANPADAAWTSELATGNADSTMAFGKRELKPKPLAKRLLISNTLIRKVPSVETLVRDRLAYVFGITFEQACLTGAGATGPLGVFTASDDGISTGRDVSTGNAATYPQYDGLIEAKYSVKTQYWPRATWLFNRSCVKLLAKLKNGEGDYIWRESVRVGEPDRLLGHPVTMSEYAPSTYTASQYVGIFGDWKAGYWIADALTLTFQVLSELYALTNQVAIIGRLESDGAPVLEEAFARVKLAAS